ncbi:hypothetical protein [Metamycoplasma equirhinis]|uniref:hypothetical protein n=1 Tax=Metamycoplasma equirhinis TaxID=92402 RepID=UPI0035939D72
MQYISIFDKKIFTGFSNSDIEEIKEYFNSQPDPSPYIESEDISMLNLQDCDIKIVWKNKIAIKFSKI